MLLYVVSKVPGSSQKPRIRGHGLKCVAPGGLSLPGVQGVLHWRIRHPASGIRHPPPDVVGFVERLNCGEDVEVGRLTLLKLGGYQIPKCRDSLVVQVLRIVPEDSG